MNHSSTRPTLLWTLPLVWLLFGGCCGFPKAPTPDRAREMILGQKLPPKVDLILVHGCPARSDGAPSTCNMRRARAATEAWRRGFADKVLFTGGPVINRFAESEVTARYAQELGLPASAILIETESRHTVTNLSVGKGIMKRLNLHTVLQVSEAMHLVWAKQLAEFYRMKTWLFPADPLPPYTNLYSQNEPFDEFEPWKTQTGAYGKPRSATQGLPPEPLPAEPSCRRAYIVVPDFSENSPNASVERTLTDGGAEVQRFTWSSYSSLPTLSNRLAKYVEAWSRGYNGPVQEVVVLGIGWGGVIARSAASQIRSDIPLRIQVVAAPLSGRRQYQRDWSRTNAPLRWVMLGTIQSYDSPAPGVVVEEVVSSSPRLAILRPRPPNPICQQS